MNREKSIISYSTKDDFLCCLLIKYAHRKRLSTKKQNNDFLPGRRWWWWCCCFSVDPSLPLLIYSFCSALYLVDFSLFLSFIWIYERKKRTSTLLSTRKLLCIRNRNFMLSFAVFPRYLFSWICISCQREIYLKFEYYFFKFIFIFYPFIVPYGDNHLCLNECCVNLVFSYYWFSVSMNSAIFSGKFHEF